MADLRVLSVASEIFPLIKTGGLADVVGALPGALRPQGVEIRTLVPGYPAVMQSVAQAKPVHAWRDLFGGVARLLSGSAAGLQLLVLDAPHLFDRPGNPYLDPGGKDWPDNPQRFAALSLAAAEIGRGLFSAFVPQVVHCHDWQSGLVPAYLRFGVGAKAKAATPATVITIHNLAFQGQFPASLLDDLQLPSSAFTMEGVEYYGGIGFLKAGLALADRITTVSPTYAGEIQDTTLGMGLDGLLRHRSAVLSGILNGVDTAVWDPKTDAHLAARFEAADLKPRATNKAAIRKRLDLAADRNGPLFAVVSRLTAQKGIDLILEALPRLVDAGCQFAVLGSGEATLEAAFAAAAIRHRGSVGVASGYDEPFAHLLQGGADAILVPSRFEPCGLTQLCALRYGSVPIVARTGGLADTVIDANDAALAAGVASGFQFAPVTVESLATACDRALAAFREPAQWRGLQQRGMAQDVGWSRPAATYARLYKSLVVR